MATTRRNVVTVNETDRTVTIGDATYGLEGLPEAVVQRLALRHLGIVLSSVKDAPAAYAALVRGESLRRGRAPAKEPALKPAQLMVTRYMADELLRRSKAALHDAPNDWALKSMSDAAMSNAKARVLAMDAATRRAAAAAATSCAAGIVGAQEKFLAVVGL